MDFLFFSRLLSIVSLFLTFSVLEYSLFLYNAHCSYHKTMKSAYIPTQRILSLIILYISCLILHLIQAPFTVSPSHDIVLTVFLFHNCLACRIQYIRSLLFDLYYIGFERNILSPLLALSQYATIRIYILPVANSIWWLLHITTHSVLRLFGFASSTDCSLFIIAFRLNSFGFHSTF